MPLACRPGINAARYLYAEIGHEVARRGLDSVSQRAVVPRARKVWLLAGALINLMPQQASQSAPCLPANQFLVDAASLTSLDLSHLDSPSQEATPWWQINQRMANRAVWVIELFERLERQEQMTPIPVNRGLP